MPNRLEERASEELSVWKEIGGPEKKLPRGKSSGRCEISQGREYPNRIEPPERKSGFPIPQK
jgi:hypothetical protein